MQKLNILGIVPARGGSKGLPGKNIKLLNGKPLIAYTIEKAKKSKYINRLILSTDSKEIADVCSKYKIEIPFMRPSYLATDDSSAIDVYEYTLKRLKEEFNYEPDVIVILHPTSPLKTVGDIDNCIRLFLEKQADSVRSMCEIDTPIEWTKKIDEDGLIRDHLEPSKYLNRQGFKKLYVPNGAVTVINAKLFLKHKKYYYENSYAYIMSKRRSVDIDNQFDFDLAGFLMEKSFEI